MNANPERVLNEALSLPTRERAALAERLLLSLDAEIGSPEIEATWKQEVLDRCAAFDSGQLADRAAADVLRDAYGKLK